MGKRPSPSAEKGSSWPSKIANNSMRLILDPRVAWPPVRLHVSIAVMH